MPEIPMVEKQDSAPNLTVLNLTVPIRVSTKLQASAQGEAPPFAVPAEQNPRKPYIHVGPRAAERQATFSELARRGVQEQCNSGNSGGALWLM
jgi:hypothetical protein